MIGEVHMGNMISQNENYKVSFYDPRDEFSKQEVQTAEHALRFPSAKKTDILACNTLYIKPCVIKQDHFVANDKVTVYHTQSIHKKFIMPCQFNNWYYLFTMFFL